MADYLLYNTADGKIISVSNIRFIGPIETLENNLNEYKIYEHGGDYISVTHEDKELLIKDRRKLELSWSKYLMRSR